MAGQIVTATTCKICGEQFVTPSVKIIGQTDQHRVAEFGGRLASHIMTAHPQVAAATAGMQQQFDGMATMMNFHIGDEFLGKMVDTARYQINRMTRRVVIGDETLIKKVGELGLISTKDEAKVLELMMEMRDVMEERGRFPELEVLQNGPKPAAPA